MHPPPLDNQFIKGAVHSSRKISLNAEGKWGEFLVEKTFWSRTAKLLQHSTKYEIQQQQKTYNGFKQIIQHNPSIWKPREQTDLKR